MALTQTPITELEAVNVMLNAISEQSVNSLTVTGVPLLAQARQTLHNVSREIQSRGWDFNEDYDYPMARDVDNKIPLATNILEIDSTKRYARYDVVVRGAFLYNRYTRTSVFDQDIECDVKWFLPFTDLPTAARWYITVRAARRFHDETLGSETLHVYKQEDEQSALVILEGAHANTSDQNMFTGSQTMLEFFQTRRP